MVDRAVLMQQVTILGSTGSIGISTLDVLQRHPEKYRVYALAANKSVDALLEQCLQFQPAVAVMLCPDSAEKLKTKLDEAGVAIEVQSGMKALERISSTDQTDIVVAAIVGAAGLLPTLAAAKTGKRILLANKEALVMSGALLMREVQENNAVLLPVDSEHNAIWQCMPVGESQQYQFDNKGIRRIILTASGGPFRDWDIADLEAVTPEQAVAHPNWSMGQKISVDSATMMNKGLEVIEAHWLFGMPSDKIEVVLHRQSIIHSMVDYIAWPERIDSGVEPLDLVKAGRLDFAFADFERFPCLALAYKALNIGGTSTAILNAANEVAVEAFLQQQIKFTDIARVIADVLESVPATSADSLEQILSADKLAREAAQKQTKILCNH
jgi:1-deoxy-D-xylulose-5-phosphate reductoisomerase